MWALLSSWLSGNALRIAGWGAAVLAVITVLFGARQAGRNAERAAKLKQSLEIRNAQLRATLAAPRSRDELVDRLRDGKF